MTRKSVPCVCGGFADYIATAQPDYNDCLKIDLYSCKLCNREYEIKRYKHHPSTCSHQWEAVDYDFRDKPGGWEAWYNVHCDKCGLTMKGPRMDSNSLGLREAWDMEDPRVKKLLKLNSQTARFLLSEDDVHNFWTE